MSTKLPIASDNANFEIFQEMFDNDIVYVKLHDFAKLMGSFKVENGSLTLGIPYEVFQELVKSWENNKHLFETEFLDLVSDIETLLKDLNVGSNPSVEK